MRLIDADALENVEIPVNGYWNESCQCYVYQPPTWMQAFEAINKAPTIDAVPVVRCKYCVHRGIDYYGRITCRRICISRNECGIQLPSENFYCAEGEVGLVFRKGKWVWSNTKEGMFHAVD